MRNDGFHSMRASNESHALWNNSELIRNVRWEGMTYVVLDGLKRTQARSNKYIYKSRA